MSLPGRLKGSKKTRKDCACAYGAPRVTSTASTQAPPWPSGTTRRLQFGGASLTEFKACCTEAFSPAATSGVVVTGDCPELVARLHGHLAVVRHDLLLAAGVN